ncbi:hypothetical protein BRC89_11685 [Halobacteriales archaeon QS_4_70_19]|nr:MAG: hypothetical protein BRC89_11685 [Halobacteriales archaeon QS_4_70_19]
MSDENGDGPRGPGRDGRLSPEGDFLLIWGLAAGVVTALYALGGGLPTAVLLGTIATAASLLGVAADVLRPGFRPSTGLYGIVTLSAAAGAVVAYAYSEALITASGLGVVAIANAGRVFEIGHRDSDSLLDPLREEEDEEGGAADEGDANAEP